MRTEVRTEDFANRRRKLLTVETPAIYCSHTTRVGRSLKYAHVVGLVMACGAGYIETAKYPGDAGPFWSG